MSNEANLPSPHSNQPGPASRQVLHLEFNWLATIIEQRLSRPDDLFEIEQLLGYPTLTQSHPYAQYAHQKGWQTGIERLALALGMASGMPGTAFKPFLQHINNAEMRMLFGGEFQPFQYRFIPTIQTLLFIWAGTNYQLQADFMQQFTSSHTMFQQGVLETFNANQVPGMGATPPNWINLPFRISDNYLRYFMGGPMPQPEDNQKLPIQLLQSDVTLNDIVLKPEIKEALKPAIVYAKAAQDFFNKPEASGNFKQGFILLLHGEPGTGKTLIASTIGRHVGLKTYQLDVASMVSKYIGETSQNLNKVFDELQRAIEWLKGEPSILFIDEADALMGKRSEGGDSKDRYANLDISNLLQRIERFPGLVILASNFDKNFDKAFYRRFNQKLYIPQPEVPERIELWTKLLPKVYTYAHEGIPRSLGQQYRLTGAQIRNVLKQACLMADHQKETTLDFHEHLQMVLQNEVEKAGDQYSAPRDLMSAAQLDKDAFAQKMLWDAAMPTGWRYNPLNLPTVLGKSVSLAKADIEEVIHQAQKATPSGPYRDLFYDNAIEPKLRDRCVLRNLDWDQIRASIHQLLKTERKQKKSKNEVTSEPGKTVQLVSPEKLAQIQNGAPTTPEEAPAPAPPIEVAPPPKVLSYTKAEAAWRNALPEAYQFEKDKITSRKLANTYALTHEQIDLVMKKTIEIAQKSGSQRLSDTVHFQIGVVQFCQESSLDIKDLYTERYYKSLQQAEAKEARRRQRRPSMNEAVLYWANTIPLGYSYQGNGMAKLMGRNYGPFNYGEIDDILTHAKAQADENQTTQINLSMLESAMAEMKILRKKF